MQSKQNNLYKILLDSNWTVSNSVNKFNDTGNYWVKLANFSDSVVYINNKGTKLVNIEEVEGLKLQNNNVNSIEVSQIDKDFVLFGGQFELKHINEEQKQQMLNLIHKHKNVFADSVKDLTGCCTIKHRVYLSDDVPIRSRPYRTPHALEELKRHVDDLLYAVIISMSDSPYASPVLLVKKKE